MSVCKWSCVFDNRRLIIFYLVSNTVDRSVLAETLEKNMVHVKIVSNHFNNNNVKTVIVSVLDKYNCFLVVF